MTDTTSTPIDFPACLDRKSWHRCCLLTVAEMSRADQQAITGGVAGYDLMRAAGEAVLRYIVDRYDPATAVILCGPGNNGGDGFVVATGLSERGWTIRVGLLGEKDQLSGDAAKAAADFKGSCEEITPAILEGASLVVDAVFGAGLNRGIEGPVADTLAVIGDRAVISIDMPSGVDGNSGEIFTGGLEQATATVSFFRGKAGHWLLPGRLACGETVIADIGIPDSVLDAIDPKLALNHPALWGRALPSVSPMSHKYTRGYVLVVGGAELLGAAFMATKAAQRAGAGIVAVAAPVQQGPLYRLALESAVIRSIKDTRSLMELLEDHRIGCTVIGPGLGVVAAGSHEKVLAVLREGHSAIIDADALSLFEHSPQTLFDAIHSPVVLTPHEGEFRRLFPDLADLPNKLDRARRAAARSGAIIVLKGYDTVIADPAGYAVINSNAPATLATAGAGDVLAGTIAAFIAGGMSVFAAACAGTYVHGAAAAAFGPGLIASDLPGLLPAAIDSARSQTSL
ncbi:MAG: NAD(P)H-hydrate dehydratase [Alphaproteobacteria bacterium]|nr:NAD(P)H-hydrate dehydratase [Alphaproteobacteria bacterium]